MTDHAQTMLELASCRAGKYTDGPNVDGYYTAGIDLPKADIFGKPDWHFHAIEFHSKDKMEVELRRDAVLAALRSPAIGTPDNAWEGLKAAIRAAKLALFVIRKQGVMPNSSWEAGFNSDLQTAETALAAIPREQEAKPVAWRFREASDNWLYLESEPTLLTAGRLNEVQPLYASAPSDSPGSAHQPQGGDAREELRHYPRRAMTGEIEIVDRQFDFIRAILPYDYRYTCNAQQWDEAASICRALEGPMISQGAVSLATPPAPVRAAAEPGDHIAEMLKDPNVVHINMLRGGIAKPSWAQIKHLYPEEFAAAEPGEMWDRELQPGMDPVAWITEAGLENWLRGDCPEKHVLLRTGGEMRRPLYTLPRKYTIADAWRFFKRWLDSYAEEEKIFSRYNDNVILDGIITAAQRRAISAALSPASANEGSGR